MIDCAALLPEIDAAARRAGDAILAIYRTDFGVERKSDESPVTQADLDAERIILDVLRRITPDIPAVAEEEVSAGAFVFRKGSTELTNAVDKALADLQSDGTLAKISDKYFGADVTE